MRKIAIRFITNKDTDNIIKWRNSEFVMNNFIDRNELTKNIHNEWLKTKVNKKEVFQFIAHDIDNNLDFGSTYIKDIDNQHKKAEIGIFIGDKNYIGKGYGSQIVKQIIDFSFNELSLNKIYARILSYNKASYNMFIKLGFHNDALLRQDVFINSEPFDVYIVSILKNEWLNNDNNL